MARALVLGVGNILEQDEGLGVRALEWLQAHCAFPDDGRPVELIDGGTAGLDLLAYLDDVAHLLVLDAVNAAGRAPGTLVALRGAEIPVFLQMKISPHQVGVQDFLAAAQLIGAQPPEVVILGVQPEWLNVGLDLSPAVAAQIEPLARQAVAQLQQWGYAAALAA